MKPDDFDRLFTTHAGSLLRFLVLRTGDRALAEDLVADTFERALRARRRFDARKGGERAWLYAIAQNLLRDRVRRQAAEDRALARAGAPLEAYGGGEAAAVETRQTVMQALDLLSTEEREAIALRFGADLTVPEIAALLDQPLTTVEGRVYRALRRLRAELGG